MIHHQNIASILIIARPIFMIIQVLDYFFFIVHFEPRMHSSHVALFQKKRKTNRNTKSIEFLSELSVAYVPNNQDFDLSYIAEYLYKSRWQIEECSCLKKFSFSNTKECFPIVTLFVLLCYQK